jgi:hypothetical protein
VIVVRWNLFVGLVIGPLLYCVLLTATRGVGKDDWHFFRTLLRGADA